MKVTAESRWFVGAWGVIAILVGLSIPISSEMVGSFQGNGGVVQIRPWMRMVHLGTLGVHAAAMAHLVAGCWLAVRRERTALRYAAALCAAITLLSIAGAAALDPALGQGPFTMDSAALDALRAGVFLPPLLRALAGALIALAVIRCTRRRAVVTVVLGADLCVCAALWWQTPYAVVANLHPAAQYAPTWTLFFWAGSVLLITALYRERNRDGV